MKFTVITQNGLFSLGADYINHMYPSNRLYKHCVEVTDNSVEKQKFNKTKHNSFAGPLSVPPNNNSGEKRKQSLLKALDNASYHKANKITNRLHWQGKNVPPSTKMRAMAPIMPGTSLTKRTTTVGGTAFAVGIILQVGRAKILYKTIRGYLSEFSKKIHSKNPNSIGGVFAVTIIYLKVERSYGRAPIFSGVHLINLIDSTDDFRPNTYISSIITENCHPSYKAKGEKLESININQLERPNQYETATLFVKCSW
ncbi:hypothetical protein [Photobacterium sanguinicancri]|uniref:hypothetical protein n=1 Tax=Photobacterium sanguinicancri TaxID=875932 RepID=UPI003D1510B2